MSNQEILKKNASQHLFDKVIHPLQNLLKKKRTIQNLQPNILSRAFSSPETTTENEAILETFPNPEASEPAALPTQEKNDDSLQPMLSALQSLFTRSVEQNENEPLPALLSNLEGLVPASFPTAQEVINEPMLPNLQHQVPIPEPANEALQPMLVNLQRLLTTPRTQNVSPDQEMAHDPLPPLLSTLQTLLLTSNVPDGSLPSAPSVQNTMDTLQPMASTLETLLPQEITNVQPQNAETVVPEPGSIVPEEPVNDPLHSLFYTGRSV